MKNLALVLRTEGEIFRKLHVAQGTRETLQAELPTMSRAA